MNEFLIGQWKGHFALQSKQVPFPHLFVGASVENDSGLEPVSFELLPALELSLKQVHSNIILDLRDQESVQRSFEGDGILVSRSRENSRKMFTLRTADCLPILLWNSAEISVIHAGWRGLAAGIVENGCQLMNGEREPLSICIGPAAARERYEVGEEVYQSFGSPEGRWLPSGKFLLDLVGTLKQRISHFQIASFSVAPFDTISDARFFSYRRDKTPQRNQLLVHL